MQDWRRSGWWSPARWYTLLGFGLLALSLWLPWLTATRTTRVETRADQLAECLLQAASGFELPFEEADKLAVLARFFHLTESRELLTTYVERVDPPPEGALLCLRNKHYVFQLTPSPPDAQAKVGRRTVPALEVTAWPLSAVGPGHCAFFYPENAERAYSRNLRAGYAGLGEARPGPGRSHRRPGLGSRRPSQYAGDDNEVWILY